MLYRTAVWTWYFAVIPSSLTQRSAALFPGSAGSSAAPDTCYFGVRFLPGYNPVLGSSEIMSQLVNHQIPLDELIQDRRMLEGICGTTDFRKQIRAFMRSYMNIYRRACPMEHSNLLVLHSFNLLIRSAGSISIEQLAEDTGYTARYIDRCFRNETGLSPKQLAKIVRFQAAVSALNQNQHKGRSLTKLPQIWDILISRTLCMTSKPIPV